MRMLESGDGGAAGGGPLPPHLTQPPIAPHTMPNHHITMGSGIFFMNKFREFSYTYFKSIFYY